MVAAGFHDHKLGKYFWELQNERSVGHHILIIWAEEWEFLQRVVVVLVPCSEFGIKPGS